MHNEMLNTSAPCALRNFLRTGRQHNTCTNFSLPECQTAFQHWVAFDRNVSPVIFDQEYLICPLLWCRKRFDDLGSCLQHLPTCPWLPSALYWCPYCHRPESFASFGSGTKTNPQHRLRRKLAKRAASFFRRFGRKNASFESDLPSSCASDLWGGKCELDVRSFSHLEKQPASETQVNAAYALPDKQELSLVRGPEGDTPACTLNLTELYGSAPLLPLEKPSTPVPELQGCRESFKTDEDISLYPFADPLMDRSDIQVLVSPLSQVGIRPPRLQNDWTSPPSPIDWDLDVQGPLTSITRKRMTDSFLSPIDEAVNSNEDLLLTTQNLSEDLCEIVQILNNYWRDRLRSHNVTGLTTNKSPLEIGLRALQSFHRGVLPSTFEDTFSLIHIAFAAVYIFHGEDVSYQWHIFSDDVLKWNRAITDDSEKLHFLQVAEILWSADGNSELMYDNDSKSTNGCLTDYPRTVSRSIQRSQLGTIGNTENSTLFLPNFANGSLSQNIEPWRLRLATQALVQPDLVDELKMGQVIKVCSRYLDYIEYATISERIGVREPSSSMLSERALSNIEMMDALLIRPLLQIQDYEMLHKPILDTQSCLRDGLLHNIREVEVQLITHLKPYHSPRHLSFGSGESPRSLITKSSRALYDNYLRTVSSLCDRAELDPNWRDNHYAIDLDQVLSICLNLESQKSHKKDFNLTYADRGLPPPSNPLLVFTHSSNYDSSTTCSPSNDTSFSHSDIALSASSETSLSSFDCLPFASSDASHVYSNSPPPTNQYPFSPNDPWPSINSGDDSNINQNALSLIAYKEAETSSLPEPPLLTTKRSKLKLIIPPRPHRSRLSNVNNSPLRCSICDTPFTGLPRDQNTNLRRHMRNIHGQRLPFTCAQPHCGKQYQRSDNLRKHRSTVHGLFDPPARKRRRGIE